LDAPLARGLLDAMTMCEISFDQLAGVIGGCMPMMPRMFGGFYHYSYSWGGPQPAAQPAPQEPSDTLVQVATGAGAQPPAGMTGMTGMPPVTGVGV
jgi:hypothetical protein